MPTTTVITGGAGFIGSHLCEKLLAQGQHVIAIDNFDTYYDPARKHANIAGLISHPAFTLVEADIRDRAALMNVFKEHMPDRVANLACCGGRAAYIVGLDLIGIWRNRTGSVYRRPTYRPPACPVSRLKKGG